MTIGESVEYYQHLLSNDVMTINEIRSMCYLDFVEGGNTYISHKSISHESYGEYYSCECCGAPRIKHTRCDYCM